MDPLALISKQSYPLSHLPNPLFYSLVSTALIAIRDSRCAVPHIPQESSLVIPTIRFSESLKCNSKQFFQPYVTGQEISAFFLSYVCSVVDGSKVINNLPKTK